MKLFSFAGKNQELQQYDQPNIGIPIISNDTMIDGGFLFNKIVF